MGKIQEYIDKLKQATEAAQTDALLVIVNSHNAQLIDLNTDQLYSGRNADGGVLGEYRSAAYAAFKNRLNPQAGLGIWDLKLSGDLYEGMFVEGDGFPVTINSTDPKANKFRDANPFGLDQKSKETFREEIKPSIKEYYNSVFRF